MRDKTAQSSRARLALDLVKTVGFLLASTGLCALFDSLGFTEANLIMVYLLAVLLTSIFTTGWLCSFVASSASVLIFGYCFTVPRYTFLAYDNGYPVTFAIMFLAAMLNSTLAARLKASARASAEAELRVQSEQLRSNLLRSISHDLRTPLTSISGNASNLIANGEQMDVETRGQIYTDIYDDSMWLINLVENLLAITRIEDGQMKLNRSTELADEIITEALRHTSRKAAEHKVVFEEGDELILVPADGKLIVQVLINLIDNAVKYTPADSEIHISAENRGNMAVFHVADNGSGIPDEQKERVFEMFYTGGALADSRRSLGLGLTLCKAIVTAHGGELYVTDNRPHGAVFTFTLPREEVSVHE